MTKKVIIITGPTAVGKSDIAVQVATALNAEIISADSTQVYKGFDIGSGKIMPHQMQGVPHHMLNILNFNQDFNVALFKQMAEQIATQIFSRGKNVIICGGTALYLKALVEGYEFFEVEKNQSLREKLESLSKTEGVEKLFEILKKLNPEKANNIDRHNKVRLIRAIEIEKAASKKVAKSKPKFAYEIIVLNSERQELYNRINSRVENMVKSGLVKEVEQLVAKGANLKHSPFKSIGYKQLYPYIKKEISLESAVLSIKQASRNYAKRQLTFLKKFENAKQFNVTSIEKTAQQVIEYLKQKGF